MEPSDLVDQMKALGEPTRLSLVLLLAGGERGGLDLLEETGISQPSLSRHLKVLREAGIVRERRSGRTCSYRLLSTDLVQLVIRLGGGGPPRRRSRDAEQHIHDDAYDVDPEGEARRRDASIEEWLL